MATNQMRREAAKRKLERRQERRVQQAKRRRQVAVITSASVVVVVLILTLVLPNLLGGDEEPAEVNAAAAPTPGMCAFAETPGEPAAKPVAVPDITQAPTEGQVAVTLRMNRGEVPLTLDRSKAPCTVENIVRLTQAQYFDGSTCHRLTTGESLKVLQCGDPTGTGSGGPGYTVNDEKPTDLQPIENSGGAVNYTRGLVAMANTGRPNSGGSQFFLVYGDSMLPPDYTVFGTIGEPGLVVLDQIAAAGLTGEQRPGDGAPAQPVIIETATAA